MRAAHVVRRCLGVDNLWIACASNVDKTGCAEVLLMDCGIPNNVLTSFQPLSVQEKHPGAVNEGTITSGAPSRTGRRMRVGTLRLWWERGLEPVGG